MGEQPRRFEEIQIPDPGFAGDTGEADQAVTAALTAYAADESHYVDALAALLGSRVLVPVVAQVGEVEIDEHGLVHDKTSDMATVLMTGRDGRTALLAFTGTAQLQAWDPQARPVPVGCTLAARSAIQDGADALVLDIAGPVSLVIEGDTLSRVAAGWRLARVGAQTAWIGPPGE